MSIQPRTSFHVVHTRARSKKQHRPEQDFHLRLVKDLRSILTRETAFFHVPNGGWRSPIEAGILMGMGVMRGVPDLMFIHRGKAFGLELKAKDGRLDDDQRAAHITLRTAGMRVEVARDLDEALMHLRDMGIPLRIKDEERVRWG